MDLNDFLHLRSEYQNFETETGRYYLEKDLCLVASFGIRDDLRTGCSEIIDKLYDGLTNTRILSGDHKDTVMSVACHFGIIEPDSEVGVISGEELR